ncbi:MAG: hypothetical protein LC749_17850 [Actinobacteria bacterium]|nr:hypothetical protein [Actinomycetota bacterium]
MTMCSTPVSLGTVTADPTGDLQATVTIPAGTAAGTHTMAVSNADGSRVAIAAFTVTTSTTGVATVGTTISGGQKALSRTGTNTYTMVRFAAMALILGYCLVRTAQYRRYVVPRYRRRR